MPGERLEDYADNQVEAATPRPPVVGGMNQQGLMESVRQIQQVSAEMGVELSPTELIDAAIAFKESGGQDAMAAIEQVVAQRQGPAGAESLELGPPEVNQAASEGQALEGELDALFTASASPSKIRQRQRGSGGGNGELRRLQGRAR
jgi:hypothetical protein